MCGPITLETPSGNKYFLLLVDDYSCYMWVSLLPSKDAPAAAIKSIQEDVERKTGKKLLTLCTERGGEFTTTEFNKYCAALGVHHELTASYSPLQNRVVERHNQSVIGTTRSMLKAKVLAGVF